MVYEIVSVSHFVSRNGCANSSSDSRRWREASWDWGFGDWESALGAASHMGRRDIAEVLLAHGARPSLFSATMMGQLDIVKAFVAAIPGVQRTLGPHGITLLAHARNGGPAAEPVLRYLESLGDADPRPSVAPLDSADRAALVGHKRVRPRPSRSLCCRPPQGSAWHRAARRDAAYPDPHRGSGLLPSGVPSVKIVFVRDGSSIARMTIADPDVLVTARRV